MSNDIVHKCCLCNNDFRPGSLDKEGKCSLCHELYPNVKTREEMLLLNRPEINLGKKVTEETVRQIIKEELNEFKADMKAAFDIAKNEIKMAKARAAKGEKKDDNNDGGNE